MRRPGLNRTGEKHWIRTFWPRQRNLWDGLFTMQALGRGQTCQRHRVRRSLCQKLPRGCESTDDILLKNINNFHLSDCAPSKAPSTPSATAKELSHLSEQVRELRKQLDDVRFSRKAQRGRSSTRSNETRPTRTPLESAQNVVRSNSAHVSKEAKVQRGTRSLSPSKGPSQSAKSYKAADSIAPEEAKDQFLDREGQRIRLTEMESIVEPGLCQQVCRVPNKLFWFWLTEFRLQEFVHSSGTLTRLYRDNVTLDCFVNGAVRVSLPSGEQSCSFINGDVSTVGLSRHEIEERGS